MSALSDRMLSAGWVLRRLGPGKWSVVAPSGFSAIHTDAIWTPGVETVEAELGKTETAISKGEHTPFLGTCRLASPPLEDKPTLLAEKIAHGGHARDHAVLRVLSSPDPAGDEVLSRHGAWRAESLLPPWKGPHHPGPPPFHLLLCEHLLDTLPPIDRNHLLMMLPSLLHPDGCAWFSFFQMSGMPPDHLREPHADGYKVRYGRHFVFLRPYTPATALKELAALPKGEVRTAWTQHHELVCTWKPHA